MQAAVQISNCLNYGENEIVIVPGLDRVFSPSVVGEYRHFAKQHAKVGELVKL